jgi:hypothetical protein
VSCGLRDVMEFETLGTPAVLAASGAFREAADAQAALLGQPALARVHVGHPVQDRTDGELRAMARDALEDLLAAISEPAGR